jgi:CP family cyanate transporter-like MFS transporter
MGYLIPLLCVGVMSNSSSAVRVETSLFGSSLLLGILLIAANLRAPITSLGPVLSQVQAYFGLSPAACGLLNALPLLIFACASPTAPWLTRRVGLERALLGALGAIAVGCLVRSSGWYDGLWLGTLLIGLGIAVANVLVVPLVKRDFPNRTALCVGLYAATMALMAALASGLAAPLAHWTHYTWKLSLAIWAVLALLALICWWPHARGSQTQASDRAVVPRTSVWRSSVAWQVSMFMALQTMTFYTLIDWYPAMAASAGIGATQAGAHLFVYQAVAVLANLGSSVAIKRLNDQRLLIGHRHRCVWVAAGASTFFAVAIVRWDRRRNVYGDVSEPVRLACSGSSSGKRPLGDGTMRRLRVWGQWPFPCGLAAWNEWELVACPDDANSRWLLTGCICRAGWSESLCRRVTVLQARRVGDPCAPHCTIS